MLTSKTKYTRVGFKSILRFPLVLLFISKFLISAPYRIQFLSYTSLPRP